MIWFDARRKVVGQEELHRARRARGLAVRSPPDSGFPHLADHGDHSLTGGPVARQQAGSSTLGGKLDLRQIHILSHSGSHKLTLNSLYNEQQPNVPPPSPRTHKMRMDAKTPSAWLLHLCPDWAKENQQIVGSIDERFFNFKPYLRGKITSQLLCRLSCTSFKTADGGAFDFWLKMGVEDDFDRAYITSSVERFCSTYQVLYETRAAAMEELFISNIKGALTTPNQLVQDQALIDAANLVANLPKAAMESMQPLPEGKATARPQKRQKCGPKSDVRMKEHEAEAARKAQEKAAKLASREERRQKKIQMRKQREDFANQQKMAAFKRAADLVNSNSYPLEICSGAYAQMNGSAVLGASDYEINQPVPPPRKNRSQIIISTGKSCRSYLLSTILFAHRLVWYHSSASDLDLIVQHSSNLWHKYNAIARSHGKQRVNWNIVAKELGIGTFSRLPCVNVVTWAHKMFYI